jgi:hypothetical protein
MSPFVPFPSSIVLARTPSRIRETASALIDNGNREKVTTAGIEPATFCSEDRCSTFEPRSQLCDLAAIFRFPKIHNPISSSLLSTIVDGSSAGSFGAVPVPTYLLASCPLHPHATLAHRIIGLVTLYFTGSCGRM